MITNKHIDRICVIVIIIAVIGTVLFMNGKSLGLVSVVDEDAESYEGTEKFTQNDLNGTWDDSEAVKITLDGDDISISGNGAYVLDGNVVISGGGKYSVSGKLDDGSIVVDAYESSKVFLMLDGADIYCSDDAAIVVDQADKVFLTLKEGTLNTLGSGQTYSEAALEDNTNAVIFSHDDLTVNGSGALSVKAEYHHGIVCKDDLVMTGGSIDVSAPQDGIHVNDSFRYCNASLTINAGDDGITVEKSKSNFYIESGTVLIEKCYEGIEAVTIDIAGGDITIYPEDDGINANGGSSDMFGGGMQGQGMRGEMSGDAVSGGAGHMHGGRGRFGGTSDEGDMAASGGAAGFGQGDRPSFDEGDMAASGGAAGFGQGGRPSFDEGNMAASGGAAGFGQGGRPSFDEGDMAASGDMAALDHGDMSGDSDDDDSDEDVETYINISGGSVTIINENGRDADGLDSNGDIIITGGDIRISLTDGGGNCAIDYASESGGKCTISGGTIIAAGSSSMAEHFSSESVQCSALYTYGDGAEAGTTVSIRDDNDELISWEVPCSFSSLNISCPGMKQGQTYTLVIGDDEEEITLDDVSGSYGDTSSGGAFGGMRSGNK
ncbi:MAG: carbohydrate-binding domain-containing protein [Eubacterium sp.]|nr:carbohydrate-binding domain-containing protein [Eubacterium sp.]